MKARTNGPLFKYLTTCVLVCYLPILLISGNWFIDPAYPQLFSNTLSGIILIILSAISVLNRKNQRQVGVNTSMVILAATSWASYIFINNHFRSPEENGFYHWYLVINLLAFVSVIILLLTQEPHYRLVSLSIIGVGVYQAGLCAFQYFNLVNPKNPDFKVAGSWGNPNIAAMFIAASFPFAINEISKKKGHYKYALIALVLLSLTSLLMLSCRTAYIGLLAGLIVYYEKKYQFAKKTLFSLSRRGRILLYSAVVILLSTGLSFLYNQKKDSADGRIFIWKTSVNMFSQKPIFGFGYGFFEKNYNQAQAAHFESNSSTQNEIRIASFTHVAYSEYIQHMVEGGLFGLTLMAAVLIMIFYAAYQTSRRINKCPGGKKREKLLSMPNYYTPALASFVSILMMSMVNFTIEAIPLMSLFVLTSGLLVSASNLNNYTTKITGLLIKGVGAGLLITGTLLLAKTLHTIDAELQLKKSLIAYNAKEYSTSASILDNITNSYAKGKDYYLLAGLNNSKEYDFETGIVNVKKALQFTSNPETYELLGNLYSYQSKSREATESYSKAKFIQPNRFTPNYLLMMEYYKENDSTQCIKIAKEIRNMEIKVMSEKVVKIKRAADLILRKYKQL